MLDLPIDLAQVDWFYVLVLAVLVFVASGIGNLLGGRGSGAVLSAILFAALFIGWTYYPHGLPFPTRLGGATVAPVAAPAPVTPAAPETPVRPRNPVRDITPPRQ